MMKYTTIKTLPESLVIEDSSIYKKLHTYLVSGRYRCVYSGKNAGRMIGETDINGNVIHANHILVMVNEEWRVHTIQSNTIGDRTDYILIDSNGVTSVLDTDLLVVGIVINTGEYILYTD